MERDAIAPLAREFEAITPYRYERWVDALRVAVDVGFTEPWLHENAPLIGPNGLHAAAVAAKMFDPPRADAVPPWV